MARSAILSVRIVGDATGATRAMQETASASQRMEGALSAATPAAAGAFAAVAAGAVAAAKAASQQEQALGALQAVFGPLTGQMTEHAEAAAQIGLTTADYAQQAAVLGAQLKNLGVAQGEVAPTTDKLISLGADLAAQFGGSTSQAVEALGKLFRGERDPIEQYGVSISQAAIDAELAARGQDKLTGAALKSAETQAALTLVMQQTSSAHGAFAREADTAAGSLAIAQAEFGNAAASLGEALLPAATDAASALADVANWAKENQTVVKVLAGVVAGLSAAVLVTNGVLKVCRTAQIVWNAAVAAGTAVTRLSVVQIVLWRAALLAIVVVQKAVRAATLAWQAAQWLLNAALSANPIGLVVTAIGLIVAALVLAYKKSDTFRNIIDTLWRLLKGSVTAAFDAVSSAISTLVGWLSDAWDWVKKLLDPLGKVGGLIGKLNPFSAMIPAPAGAAYLLVPAPSAPTARLGGDVTIPISVKVDARDPDSIGAAAGARIVSELRAWERRNGSWWRQ